MLPCWFCLRLVNPVLIVLWFVVVMLLFIAGGLCLVVILGCLVVVVAWWFWVLRVGAWCCWILDFGCFYYVAALGFLRCVLFAMLVVWLLVDCLGCLGVCSFTCGWVCGF